MPSSRNSRKQQTRITFTPLPSSSPATKGYNKQIQDRAAAVGYDGSPGHAKRRKLRDTVSGPDKDGFGNAQLDGVNNELPTPANTMQSNGNYDEDSEDVSDPVRMAQTQRRSGDKVTSRSKRAKQRQLDFSGARDSDSFSSPVKLSSSSAVQPQSSAGIFSTQSRRRKRQQPVIDVSSDESEASDLPSPRRLMRSKSNAKEVSGEQETADMGNEHSRATRSSQRLVTVLSDSDDDNIVVGSSKPQEQQDDDNSEDEMPTTLGRQPRKRVRRSSLDDFVSSPPRAIDSDDDLEIIEQPKKRRREVEEDEDEDEDEDEGDEDSPVTPRRRTLKRPRQMSKREQEDLDEDLDFLGPSSDVESSARAPRNTQTEAKSKRQQALERLKRKRSGQVKSLELDNDDEDDDDVGDAEHPDELYDISEEEDEQPQIISSRQMFAADEGDDTFVDDDLADGSALGVPDGVPLQFTRYASMKAKELFKYAVEWMVQRKINPAFKMDDEIYDLTFRKLDDEVKGLAGSKFVSTVWRPDFIGALRSRPEIALVELDRTIGDAFLRDKCEACNRSNHVPTWEIQFRGNPYHPNTLDEVAGNGDDDDDDEDAESSDESQGGNPDRANAADKPAYDHQGREVPPEDKTYYVGRFCKANAETAHALTHWRYHLYECVVMMLIRQGYNTDEKIVQRDRWSTKKRRKYANKIADRMEKDGDIKRLWEDFRNNIDEARNSKQGRFEAPSP